MSLSLAPFVFSVLEGHLQFQEYVGPHHWGLDIGNGRVWTTTVKP